MAEIPVEKKSSMKWLWLLLAAILLALLIWWAVSDDDDVEPVLADTATIESVEGIDADADADALGSTESMPMTLAAILANPQSYIGEEFSGEVGVGGPLTDRGFWIENDGARMFALIIDEPMEVPLDINAGQELQITGGRIREGGEVSDVEGVPLDDDTLEVLADQDVFLLVNEDNIDILQRP